jgi:hypothetical protein
MAQHTVEVVMSQGRLLKQEHRSLRGKADTASSDNFLSLVVASPLLRPMNTKF